MGQGRPSTRGNNAYQPRTEIGENNIPVTDGTSDRVDMKYDMPDVTITKGFKRSAMKGKMPKSKTTESSRIVGESNLITNNPFVPKKEFKMPKMPKLKFSGKGKRTIMRGKIK